jgi:hypothetical protein
VLRSLAFVSSLFACASCSFFAVRGPIDNPGTGSADTSCTESSTIPALDAIVGALAIGGAVGGEVVDQTSHPIHRYELYYGLPALVLGIVLLVSANSGTNRVEACQEAKQGQQRGCDGCSDAIP